MRDVFIPSYIITVRSGNTRQLIAIIKDDAVATIVVIDLHFLEDFSLMTTVLQRPTIMRVVFVQE